MSRIEHQEFDMRLMEDVGPINVSANPDVVENVHIDANYSAEEISIYISLFKEFCDMFSCSYEEMPDIDPSMIEHEI